MGDRVSCTLHIGGFISASDATDLIEEINQDGEKIDKLEEKTCIEFDEVNYANLDSRIEDLMIKIGLSWVWSWEAGGDFGEGLSCYDSKTQTHVEFNTSRGSIVLTLDEIDKDEDLEAARQWQKFGRDFKIHIFQSDHELLGLLRTGVITQVQLDNYLEIRKEQTEK
jgi:hypothetical protein